MTIYELNSCFLAGSKLLSLFFMSLDVTQDIRAAYQLQADFRQNNMEREGNEKSSVAENHNIDAVGKNNMNIEQDDNRNGLAATCILVMLLVLIISILNILFIYFIQLSI